MEAVADFLKGLEVLVEGRWAESVEEVGMDGRKGFLEVGEWDWLGPHVGIPVVKVVQHGVDELVSVSPPCVVWGLNLVEVDGEGAWGVRRGRSCVCKVGWGVRGLGGGR